MGKKQPLPSRRLFQTKQDRLAPSPQEGREQAGSAPKPALLQHLPKFYSENPKDPLQIKGQPEGPGGFTEPALSGEKVVGGDHLVSPQVQGLGGGHCLGSPRLRGQCSGVRGADACLASLQPARIFRPLGKAPEHSPRLGEGVSCQVTEGPDAPRPW